MHKFFQFFFLIFLSCYDNSVACFLSARKLIFLRFVCGKFWSFCHVICSQVTTAVLFHYGRGIAYNVEAFKQLWQQRMWKRKRKLYHCKNIFRKIGYEFFYHAENCIFDYVKPLRNQVIHQVNQTEHTLVLIFFSFHIPMTSFRNMNQVHRTHIWYRLSKKKLTSEECCKGWKFGDF